MDITCIESRSRRTRPVVTEILGRRNSKAVPRSRHNPSLEIRWHSSGGLSMMSLDDEDVRLWLRSGVGETKLVIHGPCSNGTYDAVACPTVSRASRAASRSSKVMKSKASIVLCIANWCKPVVLALPALRSSLWLSSRLPKVRRIEALPRSNFQTSMLTCLQARVAALLNLDTEALTRLQAPNPRPRRHAQPLHPRRHEQWSDRRFHFADSNSTSNLSNFAAMNTVLKGC